MQGLDFKIYVLRLKYKNRSRLLGTHLLWFDYISAKNLKTYLLALIY